MWVKFPGKKRYVTLEWSLTHLTRKVKNDTLPLERTHPRGQGPLEGRHFRMRSSTHLIFRFPAYIWMFWMNSSTQCLCCIWRSVSALDRLGNLLQQCIEKGSCFNIFTWSTDVSTLYMNDSLRVIARLLNIYSLFQLTAVSSASWAYSSAMVLPKRFVNRHCPTHVLISVQIRAYRIG